MEVRYAKFIILTFLYKVLHVFSEKKIKGVEKLCKIKKCLKIVDAKLL